MQLLPSHEMCTNIICVHVVLCCVCTYVVLVCVCVFVCVCALVLKGWPSGYHAAIRPHLRSSQVHLRQSHPSCVDGISADDEKTIC